MKLEYAVHTALDELRMQMLGTRMLFGFQFQGIFQEGYGDVPAAAKIANLVAFGLLVATLGFLIAPAAQHRLIEKGAATERILSVASRFAELALATFAVAVGLDVFVVSDGYFGETVSAAAALLVAVIAAVLWYGIGFGIRTGTKPRRDAMPQMEKPELHEKIDQMLTEARVILPGAQALLGFQFVVTMTKGFHELPPLAQAMHFGALGLILIAIMLLISPVAVHRLGFGGADAERMHAIGSFLVTAALVPLSAGVAADVYVALCKTASGLLGPLLAAAAFLFLVAFWYALPLYVRATRSRA